MAQSDSNSREAVQATEHERHLGTVQTSFEVHTSEKPRFEGDDDDIAHPDPDRDDLRFHKPEQDRLFNEIVSHFGKDDAITSGELSDRCSISDSPGYPKTRKHLRKLVDQGVPIGSSDDGYYVIATEEEANDNIASLNGRIESIEERRNYLISAIKNPADPYTLGPVAEILAKHYGKDDAITSGKIATAVGISDGSGNPKTRKHLRKLIEAGLPLGSCNDGYYIITTEDEADENVASINSRIDSIIQRRDNLMRAIQEDEYGTEALEVDH